MQYTEPLHLTTLETIKKTLAAQVGPGAIWIIGESVVEAALWPTLAGRPVLNLGWGGARLDSVVSHTMSIIASLPPPAGAIISAGLNNVWVPDGDPEQVALQSDYQWFIHLLLPFVPKIALMTTTSFERGYAAYDPYMPELLRKTKQVNDAIRANATGYGFRLIDANAAFSGPDGTAHSGYTIDGGHPSPAGYAALRSLYEWSAAQFFVPGT